jgi:hypothetical protein
MSICHNSASLDIYASLIARALPLISAPLFLRYSQCIISVILLKLATPLKQSVKLIWTKY